MPPSPTPPHLAEANLACLKTVFPFARFSTLWQNVAFVKSIVGEASEHASIALEIEKFFLSIPVVRWLFVELSLGDSKPWPVLERYEKAFHHFHAQI